MWARLGIATLAAALAATPALAGTLATAALFTGDGDDVVCMLSNVSGAPLTNVQVDVKDGAGGTASATLSLIDCTGTLAAGASCFLNKTLAGGQRVRCEFSFSGKASRSRGAMVVDSGTRTLALEAR